jgi:hypothetical protein
MINTRLTSIYRLKEHMFTVDREFYSDPYYFFLRNKGTHYNLYFSSESTLTEARKKDEMIKVPKDKVEIIKRYLKMTAKKEKKKSTKELKGELEELVTADGSMANSKVPILDPRLHPKKTMDQTVPAARITNDPITRGYRVYYGESVEEVAEEDLSKAFGYQETSGKTPIQTIKILDKMGVDNALERAEEFGKDVKLDKKKKKGSDMRIRITEKEKISEIQKKKMEKMVEDILMKKKNSNNSEISKKQMEDGVSSIIKKNIKSLLKQAEIEGLSKKDLIKMLNGE